MTTLTTKEIWRRRFERAQRWKRSDGTIAPDYPAVRLEDETEETLNAMPAPEPEQMRRRRQQEE